VTIWKIRFHHISDMRTFLKQSITCAIGKYWVLCEEIVDIQKLIQNVHLMSST